MQQEAMPTPHSIFPKCSAKFRWVFVAFSLQVYVWQLPPKLFCEQIDIPDPLTLQFYSVQAVFFIFTIFVLFLRASLASGENNKVKFYLQPRNANGAEDFLSSCQISHAVENSFFSADTTILAASKQKVSLPTFICAATKF